MGAPKPTLLPSHLTTAHVDLSLLPGVVRGHTPVSSTGLQFSWRGASLLFTYDSSINWKLCIL